MIIFLGVVIGALWVAVLYDTIKDAQEEYYDVRVSPGAVSYGTHSTAPIPLVTSSSHSSRHMISGGEVRNHARYGHGATAGVANSNYKVYTTSSATVHSVGSGGGGGGGHVGTTTSSTSRGIQYGSTSAAMPTMAMAMSASAARAAAPARYSGPYRSKPSTPGTDGQWSDNNAGDGDWWRYDDWEGDWVAPSEGDMRPAGDGINYYKYTSGAWVLVNDQGDPVAPGSPVGATPWIMMVLLALGYGILKTIRKKQNTI